MLLHWVLVVALVIFSCNMQTLHWGVRDLVPWPGMKPGPPALGAQSLSHWTTREVPQRAFKYGSYYYFDKQLLNYTEELACSEYQALLLKTVYQFTLILKEKPEENQTVLANQTPWSSLLNSWCQPWKLTHIRPWGNLNKDISSF